MHKTKSAFSGYAVKDVEAARRFYSDTLGMDATVDQMGMLDLKLGNGASVMIYPKPDHQPATFTVLNLVVDNIDDAVDHLTAEGVTFEQYDMPEIKTDAKGISRDASGQGPSAIAWFTDPSGNIISLIQE
ncbi:MAG TPA: VOC family protein [Candidatus Limnocylindrales bacterium]|nr:VOC family protein [Candidatus Limnocylindrales bacterium]